MSQNRALASAERPWLALRLCAQGVPIDDIGRHLPRGGQGRRSASQGAEGVGRDTASRAVVAGVRMLLGHVMRDQPPPEPHGRLWPPEEVRKAIRAQRDQFRRVAALRRWLFDWPMDDDGLG